MTRQLVVLIVSTLILVPYAAKAEEPTPKKAAQPKFNQVYVKIIMPTATIVSVERFKRICRKFSKVRKVDGKMMLAQTITRTSKIANE